MIDGMTTNFKKAVSRASERSFSLSNVTTIRPISVTSGAASNTQRVSIQDLQIEGLENPKVMSVFVNKKNMKLNVVFNYKQIRVAGRCSAASSPAKPATTQQQQVAKTLIEATNWNASWSASVMPMVGREHFDPSRVYSSHGQQRLNINLNDCPQQVHEKLRTTLMDRLRATVDARLNEIMESVIMHPESLVSESSSDSKSSAAADLKNDSNKDRDRRQLSAGRPPKSSSQKALKRTKRQTPCQQGEELDDYVDQLFRFGTRIVRAMEPITLPNATVELPDYNLKIFLYEGKGTRAYKFRRAKPAWVFCSNETISLGLTIEVEELRVAYKYRVISGTRLLFDGDLEARLSPKVQAQFSQAVQEEDSEEPVQQRIDRIRVFRLGRVHVVIRGLGNLTQSLSMIINSYLNDNQEELQPTFRMVEGDATRMLNRMLANVNVPLLSVV